MTDHNASSIPRPDASASASTRSLAKGSASRSSGSRSSYDAGESTALADSFHTASIDGTTFALSSSPPSSHHPSSDRRSTEPEDQTSSHDAYQRRRPHRHRPSGGFLLSNTILNEGSKPGAKNRGDDRRKSRIPVDGSRRRSPLPYSEDAGPSSSGDSHEVTGGPGTEGSKPHPAQMSTGTDSVGISDDRPRSQMDNRRRSMIPSLRRPSSAPLDVDSEQIVSMALSLSESRRQASKRNISTPIPPRLAPLPDSTPGRALKQHLQQQRRSSRNISPRADRNLPSRIVSTPRISTPLQHSFEHEDTYTYHLSHSTLKRAEKAKEYLELMAQYRRLLGILPPLKQEERSRPSTSSLIASPSSTVSPSNHSSGSQTRTLGRAYNPLQYIRNRKIRTRERKTIDGETQGFGDVPRVTHWVDEVATFTAASFISESPGLPPFSSADESASQPQASSLPRPVSALNKPKRPRFEWSIDPADMLADVYWLGQGDNKFLIENRHYGKIYTPIPESIQPEAQTAEQGGPAPIAPAPKATPESNDAEILQHENANSIKTEAESTPTSTRDRARQKLHDLRGIHRHNNSIYSHHDFLRLRRGSTSDSSGNENDRRRRGRSNTVSANGQDLLEKQMNEMLAKESQDGQAYDDNVTDASHLKPLPARIVHPEQTSQVPRPGHSRKSSRMDIVESLDNTSSEKPNQTPIHSGRASLEVPAHTYRSSVDLDSPRPVISDIVLAGRHNNYMPIIGMDLSPAVSRPGSPVRTPFSKVKSIFRDRSRDREDRESDDRILSPADTIPILTIPKDSTSSLERPRSRSATREFLTKLAHEGHKSHRSMGSLSLRPDDQVGLRTIFKGSAKLDDMIRGGVSKVTDLIWKKDSDASDSSDDDSVDEGQRGRRIGSTLSPGGLARRMEGRRPAKNYMDIMPHFTSASESMDKPISHTPPDGSPAPVLSRPPSRSPRFDQLKPPRIDVRKASLDLSEIEEANGRSVVEYDQSDNDSRSRDPAHPLDRPKQSSKELQNILSIRDSESFASRTEYTTHAPEYRNWAFPKHTPLSQNGLISRREVARLRTLMLCSGIKAMEISRRVTEPHSLLGPQNKVTGSDSTEMSQFLRNGVLNSRMPATELFPATARILAPNIEQSIREFEKSATKFSNETAPKLQERVDTVYGRVAIEYMDMTRRAADDADEVSQDIVDHQRLKVKGVVDAMDKMLRRRRRRFRWVRRGGWLAVEWVVVGFMWYVWFIVTIVRIILGVGRGAVTVVRWLLWL